MLRTLVCGAIGLAALIGVLLAVGVGAQSSPITLEQRTTSSLSVRWHWGGQPAAAFEVAWRPRGEDDRAAWRSARKQASERRHTISGLDAGVHYVVRVRALNAAGRPLGDLRAAFATDWSAPRLLRVTARADAALTIGWSAPTDWSPQGYRLRWRAAGAQTLSGDLTLPASANSRRLPGLSTGTAYLIRLTALNARGGESPPAVLTATAAGAPPAQPVLTDASWSELTLRAEWDAVPRATGYDVRWNSADDQTPVSAEEAIGTSPAEYAAPRTGLYTVAVRARIGSGPTAVRGEWSQPLSLRVLPAPHYLRVQNFDGERVRLSWPGVGSNGYVVEWGRRGGTKQTETRDGRSGVLEVGPLTAIAAYEFRVRARHQRGESGWSPTATMTPTVWPQLPPRAALNQGSLYVLWPPAAGAEWYEAQWINAADRAETARVRVAPPGGGGNVAARIGRDGGFEDGRWLVRVRAGPFGLWSQTYALDLAGQPPRLALELESSRDLCTAGTLTEVSWKISGGSAPYALSVENSAVDVSADNMRVNCGALTEAEAGDSEAALAAKTVSAVVTDSRGVQRQAALEVARARALPAPSYVNTNVQQTLIVLYWSVDDGVRGTDGTARYLVRSRPTGQSVWNYIHEERSDSRKRTAAGIRGLSEGAAYEAQVAAMRDPLEGLTPAVLTWSATETATTAKAPTGVRATATHDTVTVVWDAQPSVDYYYIRLVERGSQGPGRDESIDASPTAIREVTFRRLDAATNYTVTVSVDGDVWSRLKTDVDITTAQAPANWAPSERSPVIIKTHATHDTIEVSWTAPPAGARLFYLVSVEHPASPYVHAEWVDGGTAFSLDRLAPETTYTVHVHHHDLHGGTATVEITTLPSPVQGQSGLSAGEVPFWGARRQTTPAYSWPYRFSSELRMTADVWVWKGDRYHVGLDVGDDNGAGGEHILAAEDGTLRVYQLADGEWLVYCPDSSAESFDEQFHVSEEPWDYVDNGVLKGDNCGYIASQLSGLTAIVFHTMSFGRHHLTKYSHLASIAQEIDKGIKYTRDGSTKIGVEKGVHIGFEGKTGDEHLLAGEKYGNHLHFEMRAFVPDVSPSRAWYTRSVTSCGSDITTNMYCGWRADRRMATVIDPETILAPPPASQTAQSAAGVVVDSGRVFAVTGTSVTGGALLTSVLNVTASAAIWRPQFYTWRPSVDPVDPDWRNWNQPGVVHRINTQGIRGTRPGVDGYRIVSDCGVDQETAESDQPGVHGDLRPKLFTASLRAGGSCEVEIRTTNRSYPLGISTPRSDESNEYGIDYAGDAILPDLPRLRLERVTDLSGGTSRLKGSLTDVEFHFYGFVPVPGEEHVFTFTPDTEDVDDLVLEVWGPTGLVTYPNTENVVSTRDFSDVTEPLRWTPPSTAAGPHFLLVRGGHTTNVPAPEGGYTLTTSLPYPFCGVGPSVFGQQGSGVGGSSALQCRPGVPAGLTVSNVTDNGATLHWTAGNGASGYEVQLDGTDVETTLDKDARSYRFTGLTAGRAHKLGVQATRGAQQSAFATLTLVKPPSRVTQDTIAHDSVAYSWRNDNPSGSVTGAEVKIGASGTKKDADSATSHTFSNLSANTPYTFYFRLKNNQGSSAWRTKTVTTPSRPPPRPVRPPLTLRVSVKPPKCYPGAEVSVEWSTSGGDGSPTVKVNNDTVTTSPTPLTCRPTAGQQPISVTARDSTGNASYSLTVRVLTPPVPITCVSGTTEGQATYGSDCGAVKVSALFDVVRAANSSICAIWRWRNGTWDDKYAVGSDGRAAPGATDYTIKPGDLLHLGGGNCGSTSGSAGGASGGEPPSCPDALKPASGPAVIDADSIACAAVRGGGAVRISRGDYTLNVTLSSGRDWWTLAPVSYHANLGGAFLFLDLATGGWIALNPADGAELRRHAPADADGLPALLDAIVASASAPPAE